MHIRRFLQQHSPDSSIELGSTPGGTIYGTTPGGTRIVYDRTFLLQCRNSPLAKSPPVLPPIPGVTCLPLTPPKTSGSSIGKKSSKSKSPARQSTAAHSPEAAAAVTADLPESPLPQPTKISEHSDDVFQLDM
jgi:hypothetical protein